MIYIEVKKGEENGVRMARNCIRLLQFNVIAKTKGSHELKVAGGSAPNAILRALTPRHADNRVASFRLYPFTFVLILSFPCLRRHLRSHRETKRKSSVNKRLDGSGLLE
jgi:hypothetical protein